MKLLVIRPVVKTPRLDRLAGELGASELQQLCHSQAEIEVAYLPFGPSSVECEYDEVLAAPAICEVVRNRTPDVDGFLIDCFVDPGVDAARQLSGGAPVLGAGEASLVCAMLLGERISVITVLESVATMISRRALRRGLRAHMTRPRSVNVPVLATTDKDELVELVTREAEHAILCDGADTVVLGCTGFRGLASDVGRNLKRRLGKRIPVIDPTVASVRMLEALVTSQMSLSEVAYPFPPEKTRVFPT